MKKKRNWIVFLHFTRLPFFVIILIFCWVWHVCVSSCETCLLIVHQALQHLSLFWRKLGRDSGWPDQLTSLMKLASSSSGHSACFHLFRPCSWWNVHFNDTVVLCTLVCHFIVRLNQRQKKESCRLGCRCFFVGVCSCGRGRVHSSTGSCTKAELPRVLVVVLTWVQRFVHSLHMDPRVKREKYIYLYSVCVQREREELSIVLHRLWVYMCM